MDPVAGTTTAIDRHGSTFRPQEQHCTSLNGPGCLAIQERMQAVQAGGGTSVPLDPVALRKLGERLQVTLPPTSVLCECIHTIEIGPFMKCTLKKPTQSGL